MKMDIAKGLIQKGCVKLSPQKPFQYASGLKGPIYCDNRLILSHVDFREKIILAFLEVIKTKNLDADFFGGIATAGIPYASFISDRLKRPMIYIRPKAKDHGKKNQIEGDFKPNQSVILVEDLVNHGTSLLDAVKALTDAELSTSYCLSIVDYQTAQAKLNLNDLAIQLFSLTDFDHLILAGLELKFIDQKDKKLLMEWHESPKEWSSLF